jgi:hypothetical protein
MRHLRDRAQGWIERNGFTREQTERTPAYVDLLFAFGLARLGDADTALALCAEARAELIRAAKPFVTRDSAGRETHHTGNAHSWLASAYEYRIRMALESKTHTGRLPDHLLQQLEHSDLLERYVADRLRKHSFILEPDERINPYRHWGARISQFERALAELTDLTDRNELVIRIERLLQSMPSGAWGAEQRARVLRAGLEVAPRVSKEFAQRMLEQALQAYDALSEAREQAQLIEQVGLLEKALLVADHFGLREHLRPLLVRCRQLLQARGGAWAWAALDSLTGQYFRVPRRFGLRDEIGQLSDRMAELVLEGQDVRNIDFRKQEGGPAALRALLHVAGGWYYLHRDREAEPILDATRNLLFQSCLSPRDQSQLACAYARAIGQAPVEEAQKRWEELFERLAGVRDTYNTSSHFSVSQLDLVESVVLAAVGCFSSVARSSAQQPSGAS